MKTKKKQAPGMLRHHAMEIMSRIKNGQKVPGDKSQSLAASALAEKWGIPYEWIDSLYFDKKVKPAGDPIRYAPVDIATARALRDNPLAPAAALTKEGVPFNEAQNLCAAMTDERVRSILGPNAAEKAAEERSRTQRQSVLATARRATEPTFPKGVQFADRILASGTPERRVHPDWYRPFTAEDLSK